MQKLELTWIGKGEEPVVEPRILLHDASKDYGDPAADNMLIHGDNLLALKALEQDFAGRVKCIYIERYRNKREYTISDRHVLATLSLSHRESKGDRGTLDIQSHGSADTKARRWMEYRLA